MIESLFSHNPYHDLHSSNTSIIHFVKWIINVVHTKCNWASTRRVTTFQVYNFLWYQRMVSIIFVILTLKFFWIIKIIARIILNTRSKRNERIFVREIKIYLLFTILELKLGRATSMRLLALAHWFRMNVKWLFVFYGVLFVQSLF